MARRLCARRALGEEHSRSAPLKRTLLLVEGQTEERFVKDVLGPWLSARGLHLTPTILVTKRAKTGPHFKGGVSRFASFDDHLQRLLAGAGGTLVTTLLDYYGLPADFPGMATRPSGAAPEKRVQHVEAAIHVHFGHRSDLMPFLALHELEAWLFASEDELLRTMIGHRERSDFVSIRSRFASPEAINERPDGAPSKRILALFPGYRKIVHGPATLQRIGLDTIRASCSHFDAWIRRLEAYASEPASRFP